MSRRSKAQSQTGHALRRAYERYGLRLTEAHLRDMVIAIQSGHATHVVSQSNRISVFDVNIAISPMTKLMAEALDAGQVRTPIPVRVVYDKERKTIVSFLTEGMYV